VELGLWETILQESKSRKFTTDEWMSFELTPELSKRLNAYILAVANRKGKLPYAIRTKIGRMALKEWLDKHEKNLDLFP
jgi:hypothetical protein